MSRSPRFLPLFALAALLPADAAAQEGAERKREPLPFAPIPGVPALRETPRTKSLPPPPASAGYLPPGLPTATKTTPERIRPEFQPGLTYRFLVRTELQTRTATGGPGGFTLEQQARFDAAVRTDGKPGIALRARTERLGLSLMAEGRTLAYESLKPEDQGTPLGRHLRASMHRPVDLALDEKGLVDRAEEGGRGDDGALLAGVPRFGPDELARLAGSVSQGFPERRVGPGDEWTLRGSRSLAEAGAVNFDLTYRHLGPAVFEGQHCIAVEFGGSLAGRLPHETGGSEEIQAGAVEGRLYFDPLDRMVRHLQQTVDLWIAPPAPAEGEPPAPPRPVRQTITLRLLHVVPTP